MTHINVSSKTPVQLVCSVPSSFLTLSLCFFLPPFSLAPFSPACPSFLPLSLLAAGPPCLLDLVPSQLSLCPLPLYPAVFPLFLILFPFLTSSHPSRAC